MGFNIGVGCLNLEVEGGGALVGGGGRGIVGRRGLGGGSGEGIGTAGVVIGVK